MTKPIDFEQAMQDLETLVQELEKGELSLDAAIKTYERGIKLSRLCQQYLAKAEQKIETLQNEYSPNES